MISQVQQEKALPSPEEYLKRNPISGGLLHYLGRFVDYGPMKLFDEVGGVIRIIHADYMATREASLKTTDWNWSVTDGFGGSGMFHQEVQQAGHWPKCLLMGDNTRPRLGYQAVNWIVLQKGQMHGETRAIFKRQVGLGRDAKSMRRQRSPHNFGDTELSQ